MSKLTHRRAFTLIEMLVVISIIAILASIVILAINPTAQLGFSRNTRRQSDINTIVNAIYQYAIDHNGSVPSEIPEGEVNAIEICKSTTLDCTGYADISELIPDYLAEIPTDPSSTDADDGTYYVIYRDFNKRITITAVNAEDGDTIEVTR